MRKKESGGTPPDSIVLMLGIVQSPRMNVFHDRHRHIEQCDAMVAPGMSNLDFDCRIPPDRCADEAFQLVSLTPIAPTPKCLSTAKVTHNRLPWQANCQRITVTSLYADHR